MENRLQVLKEKIGFYNQRISENKISKDDSELQKAKQEIEIFKRRIKEINESIKTKSKLEQMKMTLEISSIESEIKIKELELDEIKDKIEQNYKEKVATYNNNVSEIEKDIKNFISKLESDIENFVKDKSSKNKDIISNKDLEEIKGYYKNILAVEVKGLDKANEMLNNINGKISSKEYSYNDAIASRNNCTERAKYWSMKDPVGFFGDYDEDKAEEYQENMEDALRDMERYSDQAIAIGKEIKTLEKEKEKATIQKKTHEQKIKTIENMVDEMIKEILNQEIKKQQISLPKFISQCKYL